MSDIKNKSESLPVNIKNGETTKKFKNLIFVSFLTYCFNIIRRFYSYFLIN